MKALLKIHANDNVAVATRDLTIGEAFAEFNIVLAEAIPKGHKVALIDLAANQNVIKYGFEIGSTLIEIRAGQHIHSHNLKTNLSDGLQYD
jgi:altronate hydrolase